MKIIHRTLQSSVLESLQSFPVVYINGPRQAGKTTLVKKLLKKDFKAEFITFDNAFERAAAIRNPLTYIKESGVPLIIDEVQMVQDIFRPLKQIVDEARQTALSNQQVSANGLYLLTGSTNLISTPQLADAMVGRMATLTLFPLSVNEVLGTTSKFLERCFAKDFTNIINIKDSLKTLIHKASFPEVHFMKEKMVTSWFKNYVQKITFEDPHKIYNLEKAEYMPTLLQSLAARAGNLINDASISREIGINAVTTRHYRGLLNSLFVTHSLKPWYRNIAKRLVKSDKIYFYDTMLLCHLLGSTPDVLAKRQPQRFGHVLENFVLSEIIKANSHGDVDICFYRTNDGREVDFVLEKQQKVVGIEVKYAEKVTDKDLSGIRELQQVAGNDFHCGIILCQTPRVIAYDKDIYLLPLSSLWR